MASSGATAYLVNTGWNGSGERISIQATRAIIDAILDGSIDTASTTTIPMFNLRIPTALPGVDTQLLKISGRQRLKNLRVSLSITSFNIRILIADLNWFVRALRLLPEPTDR